MKQEKIVVTGLGVICANGKSLSEFRRNLEDGVTGVGSVTLFDVSPYRCKIAGQVRECDYGKDDFEDRAAMFAVNAAAMAIEDAGLKLDSKGNDRVGVILGTTMGGIASFEKFYRSQFMGDSEKYYRNLEKQHTFHIMTDAVAEKFSLRGPKSTVCVACASGTNSIGYAADLIRAGKADIMLAGGSDSLSEFVFSGFSALRAITPSDRIRPYDRDRDGTALGEGAGILVLEREESAVKRGAKIYAEYAGYGFSNDAYHPTQPDREGPGLAKAMEYALRESGLPGDAIDYINLHGTGTKANDVMETNAIKRVLGAHTKRIMASTIKPMVGHTLGAAGAIEAIATVLSIKDDFAPPTINHVTADSECDLDIVPNKARKAKINVAMSLSAAFSGNYAAVMFKKHMRDNENAARSH
ncbi:MAG: beta-ketoacyl-[acyl-carrier-protein] synthase family protein [Oligoflexales bacterium]|nr:beta-ketoacyl-[acyl-carrier-protein] synthase family protein [Oligoflexales bacterium]